MPHSTAHPTQPNNGAVVNGGDERSTNDVYDLLGIGFGPASLAIAVALHDKIEQHVRTTGSTNVSPKFRFLERQETFRWHAGMMLPGTKMQISFIKDLATLRDPRSHFTFLNYLHEQDRLVHFSNLDTFLPFRIEFEDYLKWAARHFDESVDYSRNVLCVRPVWGKTTNKVECFEVTSQDKVNDEVFVNYSRKVVVAIGGQPSIPKIFPQEDPRVIHSSKYGSTIAAVLPRQDQAYRIAVVGAGQSAAEIFDDLRTRFPYCQSYLVMRDSALRPSDDSPFVNEVFNPERIDSFYESTPSVRDASVRSYRATNYGVVRPKLIEAIYETMYHQRLAEADPNKWQHKIMASREVVDVSNDDSDSESRLKLQLHRLGNIAGTEEESEILSVDAVIVATGYVRKGHEEILKECQAINGSSDGHWTVDRSYQVGLDRSQATEDVQIYLQGCNEKTHGLSDTLLSVLATRGGEIVDSVFPNLSNSVTGSRTGNESMLSLGPKSKDNNLHTDNWLSTERPKNGGANTNGYKLHETVSQNCGSHVPFRSGMMAEQV